MRLSTDIVPGIDGNPDKVERSRELVGLQLEDENNLGQKRPVHLNLKREPVLPLGVHVLNSDVIR